MSIENSKKLNRVLCTCLKCRNKDIEEGIGMLIPKSTRTRHRKKENKNSSNHSLDSSSSSELISNLSFSSIDSDSESEMCYNNSNKGELFKITSNLIISNNN